MAVALERGAIPLADCPGGMDLRLTLESGQTYHWRGEGGEMFGTEPPEWYHTVLDGEFIRVRQTDTAIEWESTNDPVATIRRLLRLDDDLNEIVTSVPDDPLLRRAFAAHRGMRVPRDPPFVCLVSFICSPQMRVERIHGMVTRLARAFGEHVEVNGRRRFGFPAPERLASANEEDLRELRLGYRAPYVLETAEMVASGALDPAALAELPYEPARERLTAFSGVGSKVADCVLLFSLGFLEAVPIDTWISSAIAEHYPDCDRGSYRETSRAIRARFGGRYAGYAQTYVFHHLRTAGG